MYNIIANRRRMLKVLIWLTVIVFLPVLYIEMTFPVRHMFKHSNISTSCVIPHLDPFDPSIMQYMFEPQPLVCDTAPSVLYADDNGMLKFNTSALEILNLKEKDLQCFVRIVKRKTDDTSVEFENAISIQPPHMISADMFHVECLDKQKGSVMDMILTTIAKNKTRHTIPVQKETPEQLSVVLFGLDSLSRSAAIRKLPKTIRYLTEELSSYDFKGYMKVGENTLPNLMALTTGRRCYSKELPHTDYANKPYDAFPFIWKNFSQKAYATFYAEDFPFFGTFNYLTRGFEEQPTSHYIRPIWLAIDQQEDVKTKLRPVFQFLESKSVNVQKDSSMCYKSIPRHVLQINYLRQFLASYKGDRRLALSFLVEISHEYQNFLTYADDNVLKFLKWMKADNHLENTILIFFSDHGARIEQLRSTFVGRMEDRMPVLHIVLPQHLKAKYPALDQALQINRNRLATPFDVHEMLMDISEQNFEKPSTFYVDKKVRGISLFQPLPSDRSCADAWIPENYCACYTSHPVNISTDAIAVKLVETMVEDLNKQFAHLPECSKLTVNKVRDVRKISYALEHTHNEGTGISLLQFLQPEADRSDRYDISIETFPGYGAFEATYDVSQKSKLKLLGDIIRTNKYGTQSTCVKDKRLKALCYCKIQESTAVNT